MTDNIKKITAALENKGFETTPTHIKDGASVRVMTKTTVFNFFDEGDDIIRMVKGKKASLDAVMRNRTMADTMKYITRYVK